MRFCCLERIRLKLRRMGKVFGFRMIAVENVDVETLAVNLSFTKIKLVVKIVKNLNNILNILFKL